MTFDIREHIEFNAKGRAQCPSCLLDGKTDLNLSLVPNTDGAYKCFRSCTIDQIRAAIGAEKPRSLPPQTTKAAPPAKGVVIDSNKLMAAHNKLMATDNPARRWLHDRGITDAMIEHFRLGITRAKCGDSTKPTKSVHLPAIAIPIPTADKSGWFHKKRVKPWAAKDERPDGYRKWSQYGIPAMVYITHQPSNPRETWLCEGEWDAIVLAWAVRNKFVANDIQVACFTCGAGNVPSDEELAKLKGDEVITFYDLDKAGDEGSLKVQERLKTRCRRASVPHNHLENAPEGYDVSDAIADGIPLERFCAAAAASTVWQRPPDDNPLRERLVSNDELLERAPDFTDWLVDDLLTADELFVLAASPRAGKSLMAFTLALAVARGGHFLGRPVSQGAVLYIRCEDSETKTKERELKQGWEAGLPVYWLEKFKLHELPHLETLVDELNVRLVVFDTLSRIRDASVGEGSAEMGQLIEPLQEMCKRMRCCGLLVHHTGKIKLDNTDTLDIFDTIRGSSSIRATCRGSMVLAADERNWRLCVENGWGKLDLNIMLDANTLHWRLLGNWSGPQVDVSQKDRVLEYLGKVGSAQLPQIALATGLPKKSLYEVLKRLQCDEMVEKRGERQSAVYVRKSIQQIAQLNGLLNENDHPPEKSDQLELKNAETQQQQGIEDDGDGSNAPIQQIQHVESVLNRSDVERERVSSSIQQQQQVPVSAEKVILVEKSDPQNDHFSPETPPPLINKTVELNAETQAQQGVSDSTPNSTQFNTPNKSDQQWLFWEKKDVLVKVIRKAKKTHLIRVPGDVREQRVPVEELVTPPADRFNV